MGCMKISFTILANDNEIQKLELCDWLRVIVSFMMTL